MAEEKSGVISFESTLRSVDWVTYLFRNKLNLSPIASTVLFFFIVNFPLFISSILSRILWSRDGVVGFFEDFGWWAFQFGTFPATFYAFLWLPDAIGDIIKGLEDNQVIRVSDDRQWAAFIARLHHKYQERKWVWVSMILVLIFLMAVWVPAQKQFVTWQSVSWFSFWYTIGAWFFVFFIGLVLIIRAIFTLVWINDLFRQFKVSVKVLHPDGAGGLSPLGQFSARIGYVLAIYGIGNVIGNFSQSQIMHIPYYSTIRQPSNLIFWLLYFTLAPVVFFLPLSAAHDAMARARNEYIAFVSKHFDKEMEEIWLDMREGRIKSLQDRLSTVEQLERLYKVAARFPIWPFNTANLTRFLSSVIFPVGLNVLSAILDKVF